MNLLIGLVESLIVSEGIRKVEILVPASLKFLVECVSQVVIQDEVVAAVEGVAAGGG